MFGIGLFPILKTIAALRFVAPSLIAGGVIGGAHLLRDNILDEKIDELNYNIDLNNAVVDEIQKRIDGNEIFPEFFKPYSPEQDLVDIVKQGTSLVIDMDEELQKEPQI